MSQSDYCIAFDSSGQPYIAHWGLKKDHKYILKIGKWPFAKYFYTQDEVRAYYAKQGAKRSYTVAKKQNKAAQKELKKATKAYTKSVKNQQKAWSFLRDAKSVGRKSNIRWAERHVKDAKKLTSVASQNASSARLKAKKASENLETAKKAYREHTLIGKTEKALKTLTSSLKEKLSGLKPDKEKADKIINKHSSDTIVKIEGTVRDTSVVADTKKSTAKAIDKKEQAYAKAVDKKEQAYAKALEDYKANPTDENGKKVDETYADFRSSSAFKNNGDKYETPAEAGYNVTLSRYKAAAERRQTDYYFVYNNVDGPSGASRQEKSDAYSLVDTMGLAEKKWLQGSISYDTYIEIVDKAEKELYDKYGKYQK